jgi:hypothetical protein
MAYQLRPLSLGGDNAGVHSEFDSRPILAARIAHPPGSTSNSIHRFLRGDTSPVAFARRRRRCGYGWILGSLTPR